MNLKNTPLSLRDRSFLGVLVILITITFYFLKVVQREWVLARWTDINVFDMYRWLLSPLIEYLMINSNVIRFGIILDSLFIDIVTLYFLIYWAYKPVSSPMLLSLLIFYVVRAVALNMIVFPNPEPFLFLDPKFPALFVGYKVTSDLYFSGHTGLMVMIMITCIRLKWNKLRYLTWISLTYTVFLLVVSGAHYMNDCLIGYLIANAIGNFVWDKKYTIQFFALNGYLYVLDKTAGKIINLVTWKKTHEPIRQTVV